jgi:hypothetical protein
MTDSADCATAVSFLRYHFTGIHISENTPENTSQKLSLCFFRNGTLQCGAIGSFRRRHPFVSRLGGSYSRLDFTEDAGIPAWSCLGPLTIGFGN